MGRDGVRDERERRDGTRWAKKFWVLSSELEADKKSATVRGPKFEVSGTSNPELRVALFPPVSPVSLESGIRDCGILLRKWQPAGSAG